MPKFSKREGVRSLVSINKIVAHDRQPTVIILAYHSGYGVLTLSPFVYASLELSMDMARMI